MIVQLCFLLVLGNSNRLDSSGGSRNGTAYIDFICGPRCAHLVLLHFGIGADVMDLTREIQWPDIEAGASMDRIALALQSRGLLTFALKLESNQSVRWNDPIIFHENVDGAKIGHFRVRSPADGNRVAVDDGLGARVLMTVEDWDRIRSGPVLLVSSREIKSVENKIYAVSNSGRIIGALFALGGALMIYFLIPRVGRTNNVSKI